MRFASWHLGTLALSAFVLASCGSSTQWPPAVSSVAEIEEIPSTQRSIRGIGIGDREIQLIIKRFPKLDYLFLNTTSVPTDQGLSQLATSRTLYQLVIEDGSSITDAGIVKLTGLPNLRELSIMNAPLLTDASLATLGNKKDLQILSLVRCTGISDSRKSSLRQALPKCKINFE